MYLRLARGQPGEDAAETEGLAAEFGPHPVAARGSRVALVVDEVDDLEHAIEARGAVGLHGHFEGDAGPGDRSLGPNDALPDRRLGHDVGACNFGHGEAAHEAEGQGHAGGDGQDRVAGHEDQPEAVVVDLLGRNCVVDGLPRHGVPLQSAAQLRVLDGERAVAAEAVDGLAFADRGKPGTGAAGRTFRGPLAQRVDERVLGQLLRQADVTGERGQHGDDPGEFHSEDGLDRGGRIGGRHATDSTTGSAPGRRAAGLTGRRDGRAPPPRPARRETAWTTRRPPRGRGTRGAPSPRPAPWPR